MLDTLISRRTLYAAFDRVRNNAGCRGSDGVTVQQFQENLEAELDALQDRLIARNCLISTDGINWICSAAPSGRVGNLAGLIPGAEAPGYSNFALSGREVRPYRIYPDIHRTKSGPNRPLRDNRR